MQYLTGKDYPHLCEKCQAAIDEIAALYNEGEMNDDDDPEAPCMYVYDHKLYCGGHCCKANASNFGDKFCTECGGVIPDECDGHCE